MKIHILSALTSYVLIIIQKIIPWLQIQGIVNVLTHSGALFHNYFACNDLLHNLGAAHLLIPTWGWAQGQGALVKGSQQAWSGELAQARNSGIGELRSDKLLSQKYWAGYEEKNSV